MERKDPNNNSNGGLRHRKEKSDKTRKKSKNLWMFVKMPGREVLLKKQSSGKEKKLLPVIIAPPASSSNNNFNEIKEMRKKYQNVPKKQTAEEEDKEVFENVDQSNPVMPTHLLRPGKMKWKVAEPKKENFPSPPKKKEESSLRIEQLEKENEELRLKLKNVHSILKTSEMSRETVDAGKIEPEPRSKAEKKTKGMEDNDDVRDQASVTGSKGRDSEDGDSAEDGKDQSTSKKKKSGENVKKTMSEPVEEASKRLPLKNSETTISSGDSQTSLNFQADRDRMDDALKRLMKEIEKLRKENAELKKLCKRSPDAQSQPFVLTENAYQQSRRVLTIMKKNQILDTVLDHKSNKMLSGFFRENRKPNSEILVIVDQAITRGLKFMTTCSGQIDDIIDNEMRQFICNTSLARKSLLQTLFKHPELVPDMWGGGPQLVKMWNERNEKEENEGDSPKKDDKKES